MLRTSGVSVIRDMANGAIDEEVRVAGPSLRKGQLRLEGLAIARVVITLGDRSAFANTPSLRCRDYLGMLL